MKISGAILSRNEENQIEQAIKSLDFCDEVLVIDDESSDKTVGLAKKMNAKVFTHALEDNFSQQRNFALKKAKNDWVFFLDADEQISKELKNEIVNIFQKKLDYDGFYFKRYDVFKGKVLKHGELASVRLLRLGNKKKGKWERAVHEFWQVDGKVKTFQNPLFHNSHKSVKEFVKSINYYSNIHAKENLKEGKSSNILKIIFWPILKFTNNYFFCFGFLDGVEGFIYSVLMSLHSFMSWGQLWVIQNQELSKS